MKIPILFFLSAIIYIPGILVVFTLITNHLLKVKCSDNLKRLVFIHNNIFLNFDDNGEKNEALKKLEVITRTLGTAIENYKIRQIDTSEMNRQFDFYEENFDNLTTEYPWILHFALYSGQTFDYIM